MVAAAKARQRKLGNPCTKIKKANRQGGLWKPFLRGRLILYGSQRNICTSPNRCHTIATWRYPHLSRRAAATRVNHMQEIATLRGLFLGHEGRVFAACPAVLKRQWATARSARKTQLPGCLYGYDRHAEVVQSLLIRRNSARQLLKFSLERFTTPDSSESRGQGA